jgi:hypothetical protein
MLIVLPFYLIAERFLCYTEINMVKGLKIYLKWKTVNKSDMELSMSIKQLCWNDEKLAFC